MSQYFIDCLQRAQLEGRFLVVAQPIRITSIVKELFLGDADQVRAAVSRRSLISLSAKENSKKT